MNTIIQTGENTFELAIRGAHMTLRHNPSLSGEWEMTTINAAAKAWSRGRCIMPKYFRSLDEVEARYKSWRGISNLLAI